MTMNKMMIDRRRLLHVTASGAAIAAFGGLGGIPSAFAADAVRWVSPRGTIEVLDDYPYWVAKKYGYFGDLETTLEPGPSDATATVFSGVGSVMTWGAPPASGQIRKVAS